MHNNTLEVSQKNEVIRPVNKVLLPVNLCITYSFFCIDRIEKREKYSRRRAHHDEADIDYINERNMKFNQKLARFYDPFTSEIKQNLERGTAI